MANTSIKAAFERMWQHITAAIDKIPEQIQSDLSQTDESSKDYVKGVLRYEHLPEGYPYKEQKLVTEFLPETKLTFYTPEGAPEGFIVADDIDVPDFGLKVSTAYVLRVMWDGVAYDREVTIAEPRVYAVGNAGITNAATGNNNPDTGEPFFITIVGMAENTVNFGIMADSMGEHTVSISELSETITTISPEYLPESAIAQEVIISDTEPTDETAEIWINTSEEWNDNIPEQVQADLNQTDESAADYVKGTVDHTRLPEGYPYKEGSKTVIEWDGNTEGLPTYDGMTYHVSDKIPSNEELKNMTVTTSNGMELVMDESAWDGYVSSGAVKDDYAFLLNHLVVVTRVPNVRYNNITFVEPGVYIGVQEGLYIAKLTYGTETIHPMAPEFLPAGVGGGMMVTVTGESNSFTSDKTFAEIAEAVKANMGATLCWVQEVVGKTSYSLRMFWDEQGVIFSGVNDIEGEVSVETFTIMSDNSIGYTCTYLTVTQ